jgi:predicted transcriptional regulator
MELWALGEGNVQAVKDRLTPKRELAYTTVMTMLDRLVRKHAVTRRKVGRSFVYTPVVTRDEVRMLATRELIDTLFHGSRQELSDWLAGRQGASAAIPAPADEERPIDTTLL